MCIYIFLLVFLVKKFVFVNISDKKNKKKELDVMI